MPDWDNTAPTAIPAATAPSNTAPVAMAADAAPDNGAPTAIAAAAAMSNVAPVVIPAAAAPDNGAPDALAAAGAMSNVAPSGIDAEDDPDATAPDAFPDAGDPVGDGPTAITAYAAPTNQPPQFFLGAMEAPTDDTVHTPQIIIGGALEADAIHGQTRIALDSALTRVQVQLDDPPTGGDAVVQVVDGDGEPICAEITIPADEKFGELVLVGDDQVGLAAGADVKVKCVTPGATNPGGFGAVTLFLQLT